MVKSIVRIVIVLIAVAAVVAGRWFFFYSSSYSPPPSEMPSYANFSVTPAQATEFIDNYTQGEGIILIDLAHENAFQEKELNVLFLRLVSRGLTVKFLKANDDLEKELLGKPEETPSKPAEVKPEEEPSAEKQQPEEELKPANAFIVIAPESAFSKKEIDITDNFTKQGGKLLLVADPTRPSLINSLAVKFGVIFESDYLYNMQENDINYRNIFVSEFQGNGITKGLKKLALYTAGSISSANSSIAFVDENTFSSVIESRKRLSPIALAQDGKVLAIHDLTFMTEPYNGILDNNQLIANMADWLMVSTNKTRSK